MTPEEFAAENPTLVIYDAYEGNHTTIAQPEKVKSFYEAMLLDCAEDNLCQVYSLHPVNSTLYWFSLSEGPELHITTAATHTLDSLRELGVNVDLVIRKMQADGEK